MLPDSVFRSLPAAGSCRAPTMSTSGGQSLFSPSAQRRHHFASLTAKAQVGESPRLHSPQRDMQNSLFGLPTWEIRSCR